VSETADIEAKKRQLLNVLLEAAQREIASQDPSRAMKGRFTRDCAVPIMHWLMDEYHRIHGPQFMSGGPKSREDAAAEVDVLMMLMDGLAAVSGNFINTQTTGSIEGRIAASALAAIFVKAFGKQVAGS
jgi:hypothetical protein